ncbi:MAG TPA: TolC family protein [Chitinophagaceae bacterium]|nr:TolC family protein [Chitinophagaceae bacterium]
MKRYLSLVFLLLFFQLTYGQRSSNDSLLAAASLQNCVQYALVHQPQIQQSLLDEEITEGQIRTRLADWYPQLNFNYNLQHNFQVQTSIIGGNPVKLGVNNTSYGQFGLTQAIFNRDVLLARRTAEDVRRQAKQQTTSDKIAITVNVSKAFYDVLLTQKQIDLDNETLTRLERSLKDAYFQYQGGIVDKVDYKRATIALNNAKAQKKQNEEQLVAKNANLRNQMGYPANAPLNLVYDSTQLERDALLDTTQGVNYDNRIEYQQLKTQQRLQASNLTYYRWGFLPTVGAFANYNLNFLNDNFGKLYGQNYPNSFAGISLAFPIFQGGKRVQQIRVATLQLKRVDYDIISLQNNISAAYAQALASYKGNFTYYTILKDNLAIATEVYNTIQLQYKAGIKTYLDVIFAETDLRSAQVNYTNALYQLLSSKLDVQRELGSVQY